MAEPNTNQLLWIYEKAIAILNKYKDSNLDEDVLLDITEDIQKIYEKSKKNDYCKKIMLDVVGAFDRKARGTE